MKIFLKAFLAVLLWFPFFAAGFLAGVIYNGLIVGWFWGESALKGPTA
jgi:hypothetical protein